SGSGGIEGDATSIVTTLESKTPLILGLRIVCDTSVNAVKDYGEAESAMSVYPNPSSSNITFELSGMGDGIPELRIINCIGQTVKISTVQSTDQIVLLRRSLSEGLYFYQVILNKRLLGAGKLVIQ
ncbi:MAG: T9SS type A sorting domain-containing protein, partial [Flavobacteriales bacterium]|nr:T9SS type A sorting domain-containing protein [Flavobacteriales bacterium]